MESKSQKLSLTRAGGESIASVEVEDDVDAIHRQSKHFRTNTCNTD